MKRIKVFHSTSDAPPSQRKRTPPPSRDIVLNPCAAGCFLNCFLAAHQGEIPTKELSTLPQEREAEPRYLDSAGSGGPQDRRYQELRKVEQVSPTGARTTWRVAGCFCKRLGTRGNRA